MKHLTNRNTFLDNQYNRVDEVFRNEVTWGGSLLGRLFNSTARKIEIEINTASMNNVVQEIRRVMEQILVQSLDRDDRINFYSLSLKYQVNRIKEECYYDQNKRPDWVEATDCEGTAGQESKLQNLIGINTRDAEPTLTTRLSNFDSEPRNSVIIDTVRGVMQEVGTFTERPLEPEPGSYLRQLNDLLNQFENNDSYRDLFTREQLDRLRRVHDTFIVELRRFRIFRCLNIPYNRTILTEQNPSQWFTNNQILSGVFQNLRNEIQENVKFTKVTNPPPSQDDKRAIRQDNKNYSSSLGGDIRSFRNISKFDHFISFLNEEITSKEVDFALKNSHRSPSGVWLPGSPPPAQFNNTNINTVVTGNDNAVATAAGGSTANASTRTTNKKGGGGKGKNVPPQPPTPTTTTTTSPVINPPPPNGTTTTTTTTSAPTSTTTTSTTTSGPGDCDIKCIWDHFFKNGDDIKPYLYTSSDERSRTRLENRLTSGQLDLNYNPDPVTNRNDLFIYFVRLLRRAFDLFATQGIKSGRPGGIVSPSVYREYIKMGTGKDETGRGTSGGGKDAGGNYVKPDIDTYYANKRIYNVFADGIADIIGDQRFRRIFANINFQFQGTEDKFNVQRQREGYSGNTLMNFNQFFIYESGTTKGSTGDDKPIYTGKGQGGKEMGRAIIDLLSTLAFDIKSVNDFEGLIRKNVVRYFTGSDLEKDLTKAAEGNGKKPIKKEDDKEDDEGDKKIKWEKYDADNKVILNKYLCWSGEINKNSLTKFENGILNIGGRNLIFINRNPNSGGVYFKKPNGSGKEITFIPVKLTFDDPVGAITLAGGDKDKITPDLQRFTREKVYSGYIVRGEDYWHLFYFDNDDKKVRYNSFRISKYEYKINGKDQEVETMRLSVGYTPSTPIHTTEDFTTWEEPYNIDLGSGKTFTDFMKDHFNDPANVDKLH